MVCTLRRATNFPFRLTHVLTDNGSCLPPASARNAATQSRARRKRMAWSGAVPGRIDSHDCKLNPARRGGFR